jgi:hypothetical protein
MVRATYEAVHVYVRGVQTYTVRISVIVITRIGRS